MIGRLKTLLRQLEQDSGADPLPTDDEAMQLAASALLVETAIMDGRFDEAERTTIQRLLAARFSLESSTAGALIAEAEDAVGESHQLFRFTKAINDHFSAEQRVELMEMLWEVAYADGVVDAYEENLLRRIAGLIYVTDRDRGLTRTRVRARLGLD